MIEKNFTITRNLFDKFREYFHNVFMIKVKRNNQKSQIPYPTLSRLCRIYNIMEELLEKGEKTISSQDIGSRLGVGSHNIRKDISYLDETGTSGSGYEIVNLKDSIENTLGFNMKRNACIIGLGSLGALIMNYQETPFPCFSFVAGFDSNINKIETIKTTIPVYPTYEIQNIVRKENIELAVVTEHDRNIEKITERLIESGVRGIINFSPTMLSSASGNVHIRNIDITTEFRYLSAIFMMDAH